MVRVTPWKDGDPVPPELLANIQARRPNGELIGIDRVLLKSFPLATGWNELLRRVRVEFSLDLEYLELIMLRVAVLNGAEFEWRVHEPVYLEAGGTVEKCKVIRSTDACAWPPQGTAIFDRKERALLALTDQSTLKVAVDQTIIDELITLFGDTKAVEAVATVAAYNMVSRFLVALAI